MIKRYYITFIPSSFYLSFFFNVYMYNYCFKTTTTTGTELEYNYYNFECQKGTTNQKTYIFGLCLLLLVFRHLFYESYYKIYLKKDHVLRLCADFCSLLSIEEDKFIKKLLWFYVFVFCCCCVPGH